MRNVLPILLMVSAASLSAAGQGTVIQLDGRLLGDPNAKVTMVEFGDYQCPSCRLFWRENESRLKKDYINTGKVRLIFRDFPVVQIHPDAMLAATASRCANDQGKYWQYHDKLFREQEPGDDVVRFSVKDLKQWGKAIGLDVPTFNACVDSNRYQDQVAKDRAEGESVGVQGTPTFIINGRVIGGAQPYPVFKKVIDEALQRVKDAS